MIEISPAFDPVALGHAFMAELRHESPDEDEGVTDLLRWGGDVDDETLWQAVLTAVALAANDDERWLLGDGVVDESIATRPELCARWRLAHDSNQHVRAMYRVMHEYLDSIGEAYGWWAL